MATKKIATQGDIERGIKAGTPARVLYQEISEGVGNLGKGPEPVSREAAEETWRGLAVKVNQRGKEKKR